MSREIKFRVYDKTKGYYVAIRDNDCFDIRQTARVVVELTSLGHKFIIEQFTGLLDRNGKEIYEGDIVEYDWYIVGDKPAYRVNSVVNFDYKGAMAGNNRLWKCTNVEVIGNIHENPELLEEGEDNG